MFVVKQEKKYDTDISLSLSQKVLTLCFMRELVQRFVFLGSKYVEASEVCFTLAYAFSLL